MEKEFVPYELALRLKSLGFDEPCFGYYDHQIKELDTISSEVCERLCKHDTHTKAPTFSQVFRWFRGKYDLNPSIMYNGVGQWDYTLGGVWSGRIWDSYEEAELACLERLIDKITNKKIFDFVTDL